MTMKTMNKKDVHTARTVGQTLFDGYKDSLMTAAMNLPFLSISIPKMDKFGWFYTVSEKTHPKCARIKDEFLFREMGALLTRELSIWERALKAAAISAVSIIGATRIAPHFTKASARTSRAPLANFSPTI